MSRHWPLFDLCIRTPRLTLRPMTDADLEVKTDVALAGIHDPDTMPFTSPWTDLPADEMSRSSLQWSWRAWAEWTPEKWDLGLGVWEGDTFVGVQNVGATDFAVLRTVHTGSWLGRPHQARGIGREMRAAVLHLAFAGLDARRAISAAFEDNPSSLAVSRSLGYEPNGEEWYVRRGGEATAVRLLLTGERWAELRRDDITLEGLEPCLPWFGAA